MERGLRAASAAMVCATTIGLSATQTAPQNPGQASTARKHVVIGCISREERSTPSAGNAAPARPAFTVTDTRGDSPATYRLGGDAEQLGLHVGHTVEIAASDGSSLMDCVIKAGWFQALRLHSAHHETGKDFQPMIFLLLRVCAYSS